VTGGYASCHNASCHCDVASCHYASCHECELVFLQVLAKSGVDALIRNMDSVPASLRTGLRNNGGGFVNHEFFWSIMAERHRGSPDSVGRLGHPTLPNRGTLEPALSVLRATAAADNPPEVCLRRCKDSSAHSRHSNRRSQRSAVHASRTAAVELA
jgi:hypothetical protein